MVDFLQSLTIVMLAVALVYQGVLIGRLLRQIRLMERILSLPMAYVASTELLRRQESNADLHKNRFDLN